MGDIDYKCEQCDSSEGVYWDAYAAWDPEEQKMVLHQSYDASDVSVDQQILLQYHILIRKKKIQSKDGYHNEKEIIA